MATELDKLSSTLSAEFRREIADLERLQEANEVLRKQEFEAKANEQLFQANEQKLLLEELIKQGVRHRRIAKWVSSIVGMIATAIGVPVGYVKYNADPPPDPVVEATQAVETAAESAIDIRVDDVEARLETHELVFERLAEIQMDQQVQQIDGLDHIVKLLGKMDPSTKRLAKEDEPPSVTEGRDRADAIKEARNPDDKRFDPANPLGDVLPKKKPKD